MINVAIMGATGYTALELIKILLRHPEAGNVLDLWCAIHHLTPYEGARHLADTFDLELTRDREEEPVTEPVALNR